MPKRKSGLFTFLRLFKSAYPGIEFADSMNKKPCGLLKSVIIKNELGLHARAAAKIANLAGHANDKIWLIKDGEKVDASSIIDILSLGCSRGTEITVAAESKKDSDLLRNIVLLAEDGFGE